MNFKPGDQIAYIPTHAEGNVMHVDSEYGFVTSDRGDTVFCRYFYRTPPFELRTRANSEGTPKDMLIPFVHHDQRQIEELLKAIDEGLL